MKLYTLKTANTGYGPAELPFADGVILFPSSEERVNESGITVREYKLYATCGDKKTDFVPHVVNEFDSREIAPKSDLLFSGDLDLLISRVTQHNDRVINAAKPTLFDPVDVDEHDVEEFAEEVIADGVPAAKTLQSVIDRIADVEQLLNAPDRRSKELFFGRVSDMCRAMGVAVNEYQTAVVLMCEALARSSHEETTASLRRAIGYAALIGEITDRSEN